VRERDVVDDPSLDVGLDVDVQVVGAADELTGAVARRDAFGVTTSPRTNIDSFAVVLVLGFVSRQSPSARAFERSIAAWIAFRKAARTPARSSSRIA